MNEKTKIEFDGKRYLDWMMTGEKATSYKNPLIIEEIKEYNGNIVVYTKQITGLCLSFDKVSFLDAIKKINIT